MSAGLGREASSLICMQLVELLEQDGSSTMNRLNETIVQDLEAWEGSRVQT